MTGATTRTHKDRVFNDRMGIDGLPTIAQTFRNAGYQAYAVGKLHVYPQRDRIGFDDVLLGEEADYNTVQLTIMNSSSAIEAMPVNSSHTGCVITITSTGLGISQKIATSQTGARSRWCGRLNAETPPVPDSGTSPIATPIHRWHRSNVIWTCTATLKWICRIVANGQKRLKIYLYPSNHVKLKIRFTMKISSRSARQAFYALLHTH